MVNMKLIIVAALIINTHFELTEGVFKLVVLHTNDMHARYDQCNRKGYPCSEDDMRNNSCYGGFARIRHLTDEIKKRSAMEGKHVLLVNAGDTYLGSNYHSAFIGHIAADMMNHLQFDIMCLGNHEFDDGVENLLPFVKNIKFPVVCSNIDISDEPSLNKTTNVFSSYIIDMNGTKIGVVGYISPRTKTVARPGKVKIFDEIESVQNEVEKLKSKNIKIIMALGHSGIERDIEVVQNITDIDFVIGGHSHTFLYTGEPPANFDDRWSGQPYPKVEMRGTVGANNETIQHPMLIAHAHAFTRFLGYLEMTFNEEGDIIDYKGNPILLNSSVPEDEAVKSQLMKWKTKLIEIEKEHIGMTNVVLEGDNIPCRVEECNLGDLITDAFVDYNRRFGTNDTGIAIYPAGGIRCSINVTSVGGIIRTGDLMSVIPFRDRLHLIEILGKHFKVVLEHSVELLGSKYRRGEFLQFSGVKVVYNISRPPGERVLSVHVKPTHQSEFVSLDDDTIYNVLLPDCLSYGSDGYFMIPEHSLRFTEIAESIYELVKQYINETSPINIQTSGRITVVNGPDLDYV